MNVVQATPTPLVDLAAFMGLSCSYEQARDVWMAHRHRFPHGRFDSYGLRMEAIEWMNSFMLSILPEEMLARWGLPPVADLA